MIDHFDILLQEVGRRANDLYRRDRGDTDLNTGQ